MKTTRERMNSSGMSASELARTLGPGHLERSAQGRMDNGLMRQLEENNSC